MARIRSIKPEFFRHEGLFEAERETGLPLRVAFAGLWTAADREGRFQWKPRQLKLDALPYDDVDFSRVLDALMTGGHIVKYTVDGVAYGCIPSWSAHQVINNRESASEFPSVEEGSIESTTSTREARVDDATSTRLVHAPVEGKGREGKGKEGEGRARRAPTVQIPDGVDEQVWRDWLELRRKKSAPVTETVLGSAVREAEKAGVTLSEFLRIWCLRGTHGLLAEWIKPNELRSSAPSETAYQRSMRERVASFAPGIAAKSPEQQQPKPITEHDDGSFKLIA